MAIKPCCLIKDKSLLLNMKVRLKPKEMETLIVSIKVFSLYLLVIETTLSDQQ